MLKKDCFAKFPKEHILNLYNNMDEKGCITITEYPENGEPPFDMTYPMKWTHEDAGALTDRFLTLVAILDKLGSMHDELQDEARREELLSPEELSVWNIFITPFKPYEHEDRMEEFYRRLEGGDELNEEEDAIFEGYFEWREAESLKRLPFFRKSPDYFIARARRYEFLVWKSAPEFVKNNEARYLAEEMTLYYHFDNDAKRENILDDILSGKIEMK